jgi:hypothetical protein
MSYSNAASLALYEVVCVMKRFEPSTISKCLRFKTSSLSRASRGKRSTLAACATSPSQRRCWQIDCHIVELDLFEVDENVEACALPDNMILVVLREAIAVVAGPALNRKNVFRRRSGHRLVDGCVIIINLACRWGRWGWWRWIAAS